MKNNVWMFHAPDDRNTLRDPQIPPDAKTQVRHNVSSVFLWKPHRAQLSFPPIPPDAKTQFWCNVFGVLIMESRPVPPKHEK
jgi:hypothetical protein